MRVKQRWSTNAYLLLIKFMLKKKAQKYKKIKNFLILNTELEMIMQPNTGVNYRSWVSFFFWGGDLSL